MSGAGRVETFGASTADLRALADHLRRDGGTTVAMESTGVYWIPLFALLEAEGFEAMLVEPGHLRSCGARCKARRRARLVRVAAAHLQRMQKALVEEMNVKLTEVLADIAG